jgi:TRAP-type C4-dicarboxylate transport system permease small subunit
MFWKICKTALNIWEWVVASLFGAMTMCTVLQLLFRNMNIPLAWTEATARLTFIWATFLIIPLVTRKQRHITISFFHSKLPDLPQFFVIIISRISIIIIFALVIIQGKRLLYISMKTIDPVLHIPNFIFYLPVWLGIIGAVIAEGFNINEDICKYKSKLAEQSA